ncbi:unnamed protein product [Effrenium voratum]|nr:unnamed protein product [Effrenium voratum]
MLLAWHAAALWLRVPRCRHGARYLDPLDLLARCPRGQNLCREMTESGCGRREGDTDQEPAEDVIREGRAMCDGCNRPASACICASLPSAPLPLPEGLDSILLLRHPKERRQKHQSAWILERCLSGVRQYACRRLPVEPVAGLEHIWQQPASCLLVFPGPNARPLQEVLDSKVRHLIFMDATWRYAREMAASRDEDPLGAIRQVELTPPPNTRPVFVVRKPLRLAEEAEEERWGYSTAEAAALAVDEVSSLRGGERKAWDVVATALRAYAQIQLERTVAPRMRTERPGFIPELYEAAQRSPSRWEQSSG